MRKNIERVTGAAIILALWIFFTEFLKSVNPMLIPPPSAVASEGWKLALSGALRENLAATLWRVAAGLCIGVAAGSFCGFLVASSEHLYRICEFPIEFLRALPVTALFPFFLIAFGLGEESKIALVALPTALLMFVNAYYGARRASPRRKRMARVFGAGRLDLAARVIFYEALPQLAVGFRLALSLSLVVAIASEMFIGTEVGVGQKIFDAYLTSNSATVFAYVIVAGTVGYLLNRFAIAFENRFVYWSGA